MDGWSIALLVVAGYVAVVALVRLMISHRDKLVADFRQKLHAERKQGKTEPDKPPQPGEERKAA